MRYYEFLFGEDPETGIVGLVPRNKPNFNMGGGASVVHDILEHHPMDPGTVEYEIAAYGAWCFVGDFGNEAVKRGSAYTLTENLGYSLQLLAEDQQNEMTQMELKEAPKIGRLRYNNIDEVFTNAIRMAKELYGGECAEWMSQPQILGWLRFGFTRARRRFRMESWKLEEFAKLIAKKIDNILKNAIAFNVWEGGEVIKIGIEPINMKFNIKGPRIDWL